jgi:hypothetical protein
MIIGRRAVGFRQGFLAGYANGASFRQVERGLQKKSEVYKHSKLRELLLFAGQSSGSTV